MIRMVFRDFFDQHPWYFRSVFYAVGFGAMGLLLFDDSIGWAIFGGVLFSVLMTAFDFWRRRKHVDD